MEKDIPTTQVDSVPKKRPFINKETFTTKEGAKDHFKRFWPLHVFIFCCGVLIVALPLVYVGYPNIAQGVVNGAVINLMNTTFTNPTANSVTISLAANVTVHSIFHAHLDGWNATLYRKGSTTGLFSIPVPAFKSVTGTVITVNNHTADILDQNEFEQFALGGLSADDIAVQLVGRGGLKLGALPHIDVNYNKSVNIPGLDGLQQLETYNLMVNLGGFAPGVNTEGNVSINNVSPLTLQLGDTSFNIYVNGTYFIGNATIPDLTLMPGNHTYPINLMTNVTNAVGIISMPQFQCGLVPVTVVGQEVVYNGQKVPYWSYAFQNNNVSTTVDLGPAFKSINLGSEIKPTCAAN